MSACSSPGAEVLKDTPIFTPLECSQSDLLSICRSHTFAPCEIARCATFLPSLDASLAVVSAEISKLQTQLASLESRKLELIALKTTSNSIIRSPIRRLPTELILEIFQYAVWHPNVSDSLDYTVVRRSKNHTACLLGSIVWILAQVCSSWRQLVLSTPAMWSRLRLDLRSTWTDSKLRQLHLYLRRCGQGADLHVALLFPEPQLKRPYLRSGDTRREVLKDVFLHAERLRTFTFQGNIYDFLWDSAHSCLLARTFPRLEVLDWHDVGPIELVEMNVFTTVNRQQLRAPNLRQVRLNLAGEESATETEPLQFFLFNWDKIESLYLNVWNTDLALSILSRTSSNLRHLELEMPERTSGWDMPLPDSTTCLPGLTSLEVRGSFSLSRLNTLELPNLQSFTCDVHVLSCYDMTEYHPSFIRNVESLSVINIQQANVLPHMQHLLTAAYPQTLELQIEERSCFTDLIYLMDLCQNSFKRLEALTFRFSEAANTDPWLFQLAQSFPPLAVEKFETFVERCGGDEEGSIFPVLRRLNFSDDISGQRRHTEEISSITSRFNAARSM